MAPTSDERREVAERLRDEADGFLRLENELGQLTIDLGDVNAVFQDVAHFTGLDGTVRTCVLLDTLADLIEPQKEGMCCNVSDDESVFKCSRCGCAVRLWAAEADAFENVTYGPTLTMPNGRGEKLSFCPNCGARVTRGGDG